MTVLSDYIAGTATLTNGSTAVTGVGTGWLSAGFREGDLVYRDSFVGIVLSVESETAFTLVDPWTGPTVTNETYRLRYMGDGERVTAQARMLIEKLGNGNIQALANLPGTNNTLPMFTGAGAMIEKPLSEIIAGLKPAGAWVNSTTYESGSMVTYLGRVFISKIADNLNNTPPITDADDVNWMFLPTIAGEDGSGLTPQGAWSNSETYVIADYVSYNGNAFASMVDGNLNHQPPATGVDDAYWMHIPVNTPELTPMGAWSALTTYSKLDFVSYNNRNFVSKGDGNINQTPPNAETDTAYWAYMPPGPAGAGLTPRGAWNNAVTYVIADFVSFSGNTFASRINGNLNVSPPATAIDSTEWMHVPGGGSAGVSDGDKGDITVSGGGTVWTIDNKAVTLAKMQDITSARVIGRKSAGAGVPEEITMSDVLDMVGSAAEGDILYRGASGWSRLPKGALGQFLRQNSALTAPEWVTPTPTSNFRNKIINGDFYF